MEEETTSLDAQWRKFAQRRLEAGESASETERLRPVFYAGAANVMKILGNAPDEDLVKRYAAVHVEIGRYVKLLVDTVEPK
jgi:hypothetical protein